MNITQFDETAPLVLSNKPACDGLLAIIVDPDMVRSDQLGKILKDRGTRTQVVDSIDEGCNWVERFGPPDLVICDVASQPGLFSRLNAGNQPAYERPYPYWVAVIDDLRTSFQAMADGADDFLLWQDDPDIITSRLQAILKQAALRAWMDVIRKSSVVVSGARRFDGLFSDVAMRLRRVLPIDHFVVARTENERVRFEVVDMLSNCSSPWNFCLRAPISETCPKRFKATETGYRICNQVRDQDPRLSQEMQSCLCIPLSEDGRIIGSLSMASREPKTFERVALSHLESLAIQVGHAVANIERYEQALNEADRLTTIVREVHHRIKNNLQGVIGLLAGHRENAPLLASILNTAISQLHTVAEVHNLLSHHASEQVNIHELIRAIAHHATTLCQHHIDTQFSENTQALCLEASEAVPFALVVNELIQNAIKHGYPDGRMGSIRISLTDGVDTHLCVANDGNPPAQPQSSLATSGIGLQLVRALLPKSCKFHLSVHDGWTAAIVTLRGWVGNI